MDKKKEVNIKIWIKLNDYNCVKETKENKFVILNESTFIKTLQKTLNEWHFFLEKNKLSYDSIKDIQYNYSDDYNFMKPTIEIKLTGEYEIFYQYGVTLKIEDFMRGAIKYLKDNPIKLGSWASPFPKELIEKLKCLKFQFEEYKNV